MPDTDIKRCDEPLPPPPPPPSQDKGKGWKEGGKPKEHKDEKPKEHEEPGSSGQGSGQSH